MRSRPSVRRFFHGTHRGLSCAPPRARLLRAACFATMACVLLGADLARAGDVFAEATARLMAGDAQGAVAVYEAYLRENPRAEYAPLAALAAGNVRRIALGDLEGAIAEYDLVLSAHRSSPWASEAARRRGECLEQRQEWAAAGAAYLDALELAGSTGTGEGAAGPGAGAAGPGEAGGSGAGEPVLASWFNEVSLAAANCFYQLGDRRRVVETYERVLAGFLPPDARAAALYRLGECHESAGDMDQAVQRYRQVLEGHPLAPEYARVLAKRALIEPRESLDWNAYEAYAAALGALRRRDFPTSLAQCQAVLAGNGSDVLEQYAEYCRIIAETITGGDYSTGVRRLENLRRRMPRESVPAQLEQTVSQYRVNADLEAEVARSPGDTAALARLGRNYLQSGSLQPAIQKLEQVLAADPLDDQSRFALGQAYTQLGDAARAAEAFDQYLARNPDDTNALNLIGYAWIGTDPERAVGYFQRYAALAPQDANAHDSLGEGLLAAGRLEESAGEYERAVALDASFSNSYFMLGQVHQQLSRADRAITAYRRFIELTGGSDPRQGQAEAALRELEGAKP